MSYFLSFLIFSISPGILAANVSFNDCKSDESAGGRNQVCDESSVPETCLNSSVSH
jgi:hypothetical protein